MTSSPQGLHPAKIITPAIRQRLQELLTKARRMTRATPCPHGQIDDLLCECVIVDPGNTVYIGALLQHLRRSDRPRGMTNERGPTGPWDLVIGHWKRLLSVGFGSRPNPLSPIRTALDACNWEQVLTLGPPALCQRPQSVEILRHLAAACAALEHEQAELCYLQAAVAVAPSDVETQRQLARALTRQGLFDEAAVAWKRLTELLPEDEECRQTIKILCEYTPPAEWTGLLADDAVREIQNAVDAGSASLEQVRELFDHLRGWHHFDEAERLLDHATALLGPSLSLLECREQLAIDRSDRPMFLAVQLYSLRKEYRQSLHRAMSQSVRTHLQVQYQRCERHPDDPALQLHLGQLLTFNGNYSEAMKRLGPIAEIPEFRARGLYALGAAWARLKQSDKALSCYQQSIAIALCENDEETASHSLQTAAILASEMANAELARDFCDKLLSLSCPHEGRRLAQDFARSMLDNLDRVCHNS